MCSYVVMRLYIHICSDIHLSYITTVVIGLSGYEATFIYYTFTISAATLPAQTK